MISILQYSAKKAGKILQENFKKNVVTYHKQSHQNLVTEIDDLAQRIIKESIFDYCIRRGIKKEEIGFIAEESKDQELKTHTFIIDPIDGTTNYTSGIPYYSIAIAYAKEKEIISAVVHEPATGALYTAEKNKGAYKIVDGSKHKLKVGYQNLKKCLILTNLSKHEEARKKVLKICADIYPHVSGIRMYSSTVTDLVGLTEHNNRIILYGNCFIWDVAAASFIVTEAGGELSGWKGEKFEIDLKNPGSRYRFFACHPKHKKEMLHHLRLS